jgi:hypothetical protein
MKNILLASFVEKNQLDKALANIEKVTSIKRDEIFIFKTDIEDLYLLTYNLNPGLANIKFSSIWSDTISIHRKKETNTLFTLNAMNEIIKKNNNGYLNLNYKIKWEDYRNSIILIRNGSFKKISIELVKINR